MAKKKADPHSIPQPTEEFLRSVGGVLMKRGKKGGDHWNFGWIPPELRTVDHHEANEKALKEMPKFHIKGRHKADPDKVMLTDLWRHPLVVEANGWEFTGIHQLTGSCVGAGGGNCWMTLACVDAVIRGDAETPLLPFWLLPYGRSRYYAGMKSPGEGSSGTAFAKAAREDGVVPANSPGLPTFTRSDGFVWGSKEEYKWSDGDNADTMKLLPASRLHLVKTTAQCRDHNDVRAAIINGYPVTCASNYAHRPSVTSDPPVLLGKKSGSWSHQMSLLNYWKHPKLGDIFYLMNQWGLCYDDETEVLTDRGWHRFENVPEGASYATLNPTTHHLEYQQATEQHAFDYSGCLWHFGSRDVDLMVTPNHRMYIHKHSNSRPDDPGQWEIIEAKDCPRHFRMKKDAHWIGEERHYHTVGKHHVPMDDWLEFLGYYLSEGDAKARRQHRVRRKTAAAVAMGINCRDSWEANVPVYAVTISQNSGVKADRMGRLLAKLPWRFSRSKACWTTHSKELVAELEPLGKSHEKHLPEYVKTLSRRQLGILMDAMMLGDGSKGTTFGAVYYTSSKRLADDVQEMCLKIGTPADIRAIDRRGRAMSGGITRHIEYHVKIKQKQRTPVCTGGWNPLLVPYHGKVRCVTVPNGLLYVRRNGRAVWSGNSAHGKDPSGAPPGGVWITAKDVDWICNDEVFAFSQYNGFPSQTFTWD